MDEENHEIVDLTGRLESMEQMPMKVRNDCKSDGNDNDGMEENGTEIEKKAVSGDDIPDSNGRNYDVPDAINSEIEADAEQELLKETKMVEEENGQQEQNSQQQSHQEALSNHEPKGHDVCNHHHDAGAAEGLINNSHKEFLQVPTRMSTKKKRKGCSHHSRIHNIQMPVNPVQTSVIVTETTSTGS